MNEREMLMMEIADFLGDKPVSESLREIVFAWCSLPRVLDRFPSLTPAEVREEASEYLALVHEAALH